MKRRVHRKRKLVREDSRPNLFSLVGMAVAAFFAGAVIRILSGYEAALATGLFWLMAVLVAFFAGLFYFAYFLLPLDGDLGWDEGFRLLQQFFFDRLRGQKNLPTTLSSSFQEIGAGMVESHQTLAITRNNEFTRATEPGFVRLHPGERITEIVDLRMQERIQVVKAITRDGIPLTTTVTVRFQVRQDPDPQDEHVPYPVDRDAVFRVAYSGSVDDSTELMLWHERICRQVAADLVAEISLCDLESLYQTGETSTINKIRAKLQDDFREQFREVFAYQSPEECPIGNLTVSIGQLRPPDDVNEQRIKDWRSHWELRIRNEETDGETTIMRRTMEEQRRTQMEVTLNLLENLEKMRRSSRTPQELRETVRLHIVNTLEDVMKEDDGQASLSEHMMFALAQTLSWLRESGEEGEL